MDRATFIRIIENQPRPQIRIAVKQPTTYTVNTQEVECDDLEKTSSQFPINSLLPVRLVTKRNDDKCTFNTKFDGQPKPEDKDVQVKYAEPDAILVKGPLGEVYQQKNRNKWTCNSPTSCQPVREVRYVVKVTEEIMKVMKDEYDRYCIPDGDVFKIIPSYDNTEMPVMLNDWIVISNGDFYRVYGRAFDMTYKILTGGVGIYRKLEDIPTALNGGKTKKKPTINYTVTKSSIGSPGGRYSSRQGPAAAARKAASQRFQSQTSTRKTKITLTIRQLGSDKEFSYEAKREKLAKPVVRTISGQTVTSKYQILVKAS
jgi:hypothetical protein